jgi:hypothetical protein
MKAVKLVHQGELDSLTLVAGDGDFLDMLRFLKDDLHKDLSLFSYKSSCADVLKKVVQDDD